MPGGSRPKLAVVSRVTNAAIFPSGPWLSTALPSLIVENGAKAVTSRSADAHALLASALNGFSPSPEFPEIAEAQTLLGALTR